VHLAAISAILVAAAVCTPDASGITYNESVNVALAVSMPDGGLITPVLTNADTTDIYQLSRNWAVRLSPAALASITLWYHMLAHKSKLLMSAASLPRLPWQGGCAFTEG
jgi:2-oxoacid dehydrogenases acyltransferase (catalytic domain)